MKEYHNKMRKHIMRGIVLLIIAVFCLFFVDSKFYAVACFSFAASQFVFAYSDIKEQGYVDRYGDPTKEDYDEERAERMMEEDAKRSAERKLRRMAESDNEEMAAHAKKLLVQDEFRKKQELTGSDAADAADVTDATDAAASMSEDRIAAEEEPVWAEGKPEVDVDAELVSVDE